MRCAFAGVLVMLISTSAFAADAPAPVNIPGLTPPPSQQSATSVPAPPKPIIATLNDGSRVEFDADNTVWVTAPDGTRTAAPDGTLTLRDGTPFEVKTGKRVNEE